ncbi:reeler domain containing 1, partial [Alosa pseudoharengus]|uniref:reeler domain containing 1 n=1 Tax=Alosa pseudoharengus TaxID=34774 RepID=UPI003F8B5012
MRPLRRTWCECVLWSVCLCVCVLSGGAAGFSHGATSSSCRDLKPGHVRAQHTHHTHTHPAFTLQPSRTEYLPQQTLTVSLRSARPFMGFMLQARALRDDTVVGEFLRPPPGTQRMRCLREGDTLTHADKQLKRNISFTWRAPDQPCGDVRFYITVVQSYFVYWSQIQSAVVQDGTRS